MGKGHKTNMGASTSSCRDGSRVFRAIPHNYHSVTQLRATLAASGLSEGPEPSSAQLQQSKLVLGIDFGEAAHRQGRSLHCTRHLVPNPFQRVLKLLPECWGNHPQPIQAFGFGLSLFGLHQDWAWDRGRGELHDAGCESWEQVLQRYSQIAPDAAEERGVSKLAPMIQKA